MEGSEHDFEAMIPEPAVLLKQMMYFRRETPTRMSPFEFGGKE